MFKSSMATPSDTRSLKIINTKTLLEESLENFLTQNPDPLKIKY